MQAYLALLSPRFLSMVNRVKRGEEGSITKLFIMASVAIVFWAAIFLGFFKALAYFQAAEGFGQVLAKKLMSMIWVTFFAILTFSNIITTLSSFFLSKDLEMLHASPTSLESIFWARLTSTLVDSSWMVIFFGLPVFLAYGMVFSAGPLYYLILLVATIPFLVLAGAIGVAFTLLLVNIFPAQRTKDLLLLLSIMLIIILYLLFRIMRPERLVNPDDFATMVSYFASLRTPSSPYLPSHWITEALWPHLVPGTYSESGFYLIMLFSAAAAAAVLTSFVSNRVYGYGFSKSQEASRRIITAYSPLELLAFAASRPFAPASRAIVVKDIKSFFRDNTQWTQILLLLALITVYLYNFSVLPLKKSPIPTFYLQNFISFLNIGLASFVVASLGVRFVFTSISQEGFAYWIIRSSPISLKRFLWTKYALYAPPLIIVSEILIVVSNHFLNVTAFMMIISTITIFFITLGILGLAVGLGAIYPRFESESVIQVATGFGGMMFMILSAIFVAVIVILEAWPVYTIFVAQMRGVPLPVWKLTTIFLCFMGVLLTMMAAIFWPIRLGHKALTARESS